MQKKKSNVRTYIYFFKGLKNALVKQSLEFETENHCVYELNRSFLFGFKFQYLPGCFGSEYLKKKVNFIKNAFTKSSYKPTLTEFRKKRLFKIDFSITQNY